MVLKVVKTTKVDDLWLGRQASRRKAICQVLVDGVDVTARLNPHLISVTVVDKIGDSTDTCALELDDRDASLEIPGYTTTLADGTVTATKIEVWLGWHSEGLYQLFEGTTHQIESGFGRKHGGRRLWIDAFGTALDGKGRTLMNMHWGEGAPPGQAIGDMVSLKTVLEAAGKQAGYEVHVGAEMGDVKRDYWAMTGESFHHFGARMAKELGGTFKISGGKVSMTSALGFTNAAGDVMAEVTAEWGKNLISWRIKPYVARAQAKAANTTFFDLQKSVCGQVSKAIGAAPSRVEAVAGLPAPAPNKAVGSQVNEGLAAISAQGAGTGWVQINGEPQARAGTYITIIGARPGVDGRYLIEESEHVYSRAGGYLTRCKLTYPNPSAADTPSTPSALPQPAS
jgi:uncharacterized protein